MRCLLDAPEFAPVSELLEGWRRAVTERGLPVIVISTAGFLRDASLRLEYGRHDVESFYSGWTDDDALVREVLGPLAGDPPTYLPSLRDPVTNRSTHVRPQPAAPACVVIVTGPLLLRTALPADLRVHVAVSRQARRRLAPDELAWTLPAYDRYDLDVDPYAISDAVVRLDDGTRPALAVRTSR